jgi:drug/metabolite transporter (DMT)-like permease
VIRVALGAVCISFAPALVNWIGVGPTLVALYRTGLAMLVLVPWVLVTRRDALRTAPRTAVLLLAAAGLAFAVDLFAWHRSVRYAGTGLGTMLANTQVFYLSALGILLYREAVTWRFLGGVALAVVGLVLLAGERPAWADPDVYAIGVVYGVLTGAAYSCYILSLERAQRAHPALGPPGTLAGALVGATLFLGPLTAWSGELAVPGTRDLLLLGALALGPQILGWLLIVRGLQTAPVSRAGLVLLAQPALATVWGALFFDEMLTPRQVAGAVLTLVAIALGSRR